MTEIRVHSLFMRFNWHKSKMCQLVNALWPGDKACQNVKLFSGRATNKSRANSRIDLQDRRNTQNINRKPGSGAVPRTACVSMSLIFVGRESIKSYTPPLNLPQFIIKTSYEANGHQEQNTKIIGERTKGPKEGRITERKKGIGLNENVCY